MPKPDKTLQKELQASITDEHRFKILNKILASQIQQYIKRVIHHDQVDLFPGLKHSSHEKSVCYTHINKRKDKKHMIISIESEKTI